LVLFQKSGFGGSLVYETHLALILAVIALWVAARRQKRLPSYRLEWQELSARNVYARRFVLLGSDGERGSTDAAEFYSDRDGWPTVAIPSIVDNERWIVSVRFGRGQGGFRAEFSMDTPAAYEGVPPFRFLSLAFSPSDLTVVELGPPIKFSPPQISIFDGKEVLIAKFP
jgi:hypothetical protein